MEYTTSDLIAAQQEYREARRDLDHLYDMALISAYHTHVDYPPEVLASLVRNEILEQSAILHVLAQKVDEIRERLDEYVREAARESHEAATSKLRYEEKRMRDMPRLVMEHPIG